jgi:hypothetical protein
VTKTDLMLESLRPHIRPFQKPYPPIGVAGVSKLPDSYASVRQLAGRKGEVWGAESAADKLIVIKSE